jgi:hypothetical protein
MKPTSYQETQTELRSVFYSLVNYKRLGRLKEKGSAAFYFTRVIGNC